MIPRFKVKLFQKVNLKKINFPPERVLSWEEGLRANHEYMDVRGLSWEVFREVYDYERKKVLEIGAIARSESDFEKLMGEAEIVCEEEVELWGFELGIASPSIAVSAFGCAPVSSCRHHPERSNEEEPYVAFWASKKQAEKITKLVRDKPLGIMNYDLEGYGGLLVFATNVLDMINFGEDLYGLAKKSSHRG